MSRRRGVASLVLILALAGCQGVDLSKALDIKIQTASLATPDQARQVVAMIYAQAPNSAFEALPFADVNFWQAAEGSRDRLPQLRPWFNQGVIGNTSGGFVAIRDNSQADQVRALVRAENNNRAAMYRSGSDLVGYDANVDDDSWLPYEQASYGQAWIEMAPTGWWSRDASGIWQRKGG
jgi:hypothetical protein